MIIGLRLHHQTCSIGRTGSQPLIAVVTDGPINRTIKQTMGVVAEQVQHRPLNEKSLKHH